MRGQPIRISVKLFGCEIILEEFQHMRRARYLNATDGRTDGDRQTEDILSNNYAVEPSRGKKYGCANAGSTTRFTREHLNVFIHLADVLSKNASRLHEADAVSSGVARVLRTLCRFM